MHRRCTVIGGSSLPQLILFRDGVCLELSHKLSTGRQLSPHSHCQLIFIAFWFEKWWPINWILWVASQHLNRCCFVSGFPLSNVVSGTLLSSFVSGFLLPIVCVQMLDAVSPGYSSTRHGIWNPCLCLMVAWSICHKPCPDINFKGHSLFPFLDSNFLLFIHSPLNLQLNVFVYNLSIKLFWAVVCYTLLNYFVIWLFCFLFVIFSLGVVTFINSAVSLSVADNGGALKFFFFFCALFCCVWWVLSTTTGPHW